MGDFLDEVKYTLDGVGQANSTGGTIKLTAHTEKLPRANENT